MEAVEAVEAQNQNGFYERVKRGHEMNTIAQVEQYAAAQGMALTPAERAKVAAAQQAERARLETLSAATVKHTFADRWNNFYPRLLQTIVSVGETLLTFAQSVIVNLGVPTVLILLLLVEHQRVLHGVLLFEQDAGLAAFASAALVLLNLVLEFQVHYVEHRAGYEAERARRWSLRLWASNMAYRLGVGEHWQEQHLSPAERYRKLLSLVTFSILTLALAGSMRGVIEQQRGAWYEALQAIVIQSTLLEMATWAGGLLFAAAAVLSAQGLSRYVAIRCVEIVATMQQVQHEQQDPHAAAVEQAGAAMALAILNARSSRGKPAAPRPTPASVPAIEDEDTRPTPASSV